ncbi:hypothetical protein CDAR_40091 [Caerostris darwini]|uniref:ATPase AAA-type core domain-containing protein n=1 Tax=Caerostris darwini TaxID=1538125 RepID=A0AAV4RDH6_9ARAC|nr:hypothetical protein CDAR_40091 [Caerostris darwini]
MRPSIHIFEIESNVLNDSLLRLYRKELKEKESSFVQNENDAEDKLKKMTLLKPLPQQENEGEVLHFFHFNLLILAIIPQNSTVDINDVGGLKKHLKKQILQIFVHYNNISSYKAVEIPPVRGVLFYGSKGCEKKYLVQAIAGELKSTSHKSCS